MPPFVTTRAPSDVSKRARASSRSLSPYERAVSKTVTPASDGRGDRRERALLVAILVGRQPHAAEADAQLRLAEPGHDRVVLRRGPASAPGAAASSAAFRRRAVRRHSRPRRRRCRRHGAQACGCRLRRTATMPVSAGHLDRSRLIGGRAVAELAGRVASPRPTRCRRRRQRGCGPAPAETATMFDSPATCFGVSAFVFVPSPSWPCALSPTPRRFRRS